MTVSNIPMNTLSFFLMITLLMSSFTMHAAPIWEYVQNGQLKKMQKAIDKGADIDSISDGGKTALMYAAIRVPAAVSPLLKAGAEVNAKDEDGSTPLMLAIAFGGTPEVIEKLLKSGAAVNSKNTSGATALMLAAAARPNIVDRLLQAGADPSIKLPSTGYTAIWFAEKAGNTSAFTSYFEKEEKPWNAAQKHNSLQAYNDYLHSHPNGLHKEQALEAIATINATLAIKKRKASQACTLNEESWVYLSKACLNGKANGQGKSENSEGLKFIGLFKKGTRIKGEIYFNDVLKYDGPIADGRPDGEGVCMHEGEPEECKYYKGKRIDTIFKVRLENEKQRLAINENLDKTRAAIEEIKNRTVQQQHQNNDPNSFGNIVKKEATRAIFDKLF